LGAGGGSSRRTKDAFLGCSTLLPSLSGDPLVLLVDDTTGSDHLVVIDSNRRIQHHTFNRSQLSSYLAYDRGYKGYGLTETFQLYPPISPHDGYSSLEKALREWIDAETPLSPPLQLLKNACEETNEEFISTWIAFLREWDRSGKWIYPADRPLPARLGAVFSALKWSPPLMQGAVWLSNLQGAMVEDFLASKPLLASLRTMQWPLLDQLEQSENEDDILMAHGQQLLSILDQLPPIDPPPPKTAEEHSALLSSLFRAYGLHYRKLIPPEGWADPVATDELVLECPLTLKTTPEEPLKKWEDNTPKITFRIGDGRKSEVHSLVYDRQTTSLKWPALDGEVLLRYQPAYKEIPYTIRLRKTRQVNYPGGNQPFAYESELLVTDKRTGKIEPAQISMNNVYETWDGYRFYMAGITPTDGTTAQRAQIVVNHDPVKYKLTYPGGVIITLGILLLFGQKTLLSNRKPKV
jgi:hypothetical protein